VSKPPRRRSHPLPVPEVLTAQDIRLDLAARDRDGVLAELVDVLAANGHVSDPARMLKDLLERESLGSTGVGHGIAFPHARSSAARRLHMALGISRAGIPYGTLDNQPAHLVLLEVAPPDAAGEQLQALARIARLMTDEDLRANLLAARSPNEVVRLLASHTRMERADRP
jgi:fructose PTS system EIIBC or EIIC component